MAARKTTRTTRKKSTWVFPRFVVGMVLGIVMGGVTVHFVFMPSSEDVCYELFGSGNMEYRSCVAHLDNIGM